MGCKLVEQDMMQGIPVSQMQDGQVGVTVAWGNANCVGMVIQRHGKKLVAVGENFGQGWDGITECEECRVRILQPGERIEIV